MTTPRDFNRHAPRGQTSLRLARAARDELALLTVWFRAAMRRGLEWLIRSGARPTGATLLHLEGAEAQFPQIRAIWRDRTIGGTTTLGAPFPEAEVRAPVIDS